jgi:hypothetical protein
VALVLDVGPKQNKYAEPISYEFWKKIVKLVDYVCKHWADKDEGIWEVRGPKQHFTYSKVPTRLTDPTDRTLLSSVVKTRDDQIGSDRIDRLIGCNL